MVEKVTCLTILLLLSYTYMLSHFQRNLLPICKRPTVEVVKAQVLYNHWGVAARSSMHSLKELAMIKYGISRRHDLPNTLILDLRAMESCMSSMMIGRRRHQQF